MQTYKNLAKIINTELGYQNGIFTYALCVDYSDSGTQYIGMHVLGGEYGMVMIKKIIDTVGVKKWEDLTGQMVYVLTSKPLTLGDDGRDITGLQGLFKTRNHVMDFESIRKLWT